MQGISFQTIYRESYTAPVIAKYNISGIKPVHFVTGKYHGRQGPTAMECRLKELSAKCKDPLWERLSPVHRDIQMAKVEDDHWTPKKKIHPCFEQKPNRFLLNLKEQYPKLYDELKKISQEEDREEVRRTTFQIDFGHLPEYVRGLYPENEAGGCHELSKISSKLA